MIYSRELKSVSKDNPIAIEQLRNQVLTIQRETQQTITLMSTNTDASIEGIKTTFKSLEDAILSLDARITALEEIQP